MKNTHYDSNRCKSKFTLHCCMCAQSCAPIVANYFINLNLKFQRTLRASLDLPGDKKYDDI